MDTKPTKKKRAVAKASGPSRTYPDLHDHIEALKKAGLLIVVDRKINKDTEMHPLVRWQYRGGVREEDRKAFLFTNVTDSKGRKFDMPVLVCGLAGNRAIYSLGIGCPIEGIRDKWIKAMSNPIAPKVVTDAPCQEIVYKGADLKRGHGLDDLPVPISTPGWDNAPYTTSSNFITKDPDTGIQNMGNYRGQIRAPDRMGMNTSVELRTGGYLHWEKWKAKGLPMPVAVVMGGPPPVSYTSAQKIPEAYDELHIAGGLLGAPLNVVKAKTVDLLVPAEAEIVIEGFVSTKDLEPEAPFGESHGHVNLAEYNGYVDVTCITRRKNAVLTSWLSQLAPSESTCIRKPATEAALMIHLRDNLGIKGVYKVVAHEPLTSLHKIHVIQFEKGVPQTEIWRALYGASSFRRVDGKWVVAVDKDIDAENSDAILWALAFRCKPHRDVQMIPHKEEGHGPHSVIDKEDSSLLFNAVLKETFPPVALPKKEYMENARQIWEELGLQKLRPESPWYGYDLGEWNEHLENQAQLAVKSEYWETGKWCAKRRRSDVKMNTEMRILEDDPDYGGQVKSAKPAKKKK